MPAKMLGAGGWLCAVALAVAGCSRQTRIEAAAREGVLLIGNGAEPKELDPALMEAEVEYNIDTALFEGLTNIANDGETILPGVADRWDISADGRTYTFHLRPDARWSDGSPLTASDFVYAFRRIFTPSIASVDIEYGYCIEGAEDMVAGRGTALGVQALDPHVLEIRLRYPVPYLLYMMAGAPFVPVPRAVVEKFGGGARRDSAWSRPGNMVGNGAFLLSAWRPDQEVDVIRNPYYWDRGRVRLRQVHFFPTDNLVAEEMAFRAGQLHITYSLPPDRIEAYRGDSRLHITPQLESILVEVNVRAHPFDDPRVRRAFALAIDRDRIVPRVSHGGYSPGHSLTRPGTGGYQPPLAAEYDPAEARRLLAEAGYPGGAGFPPVSLSCANDRREILAEPVQAAWESVLGVRVAIRRDESKVFFDELSTKGYQIALMGFFYGIQAPETVLIIGQKDCAWNNTQWSSSAYESAFHHANYAATTAVRRAAYDRMERIIQQDAPYIPLAFSNQPHLISPMVQGWRDNPLYAIDWRELWLDPGARGH